MYVCICNGYRDCQISALAASGIRCAVAAYHTLGRGPRCGRCLETAQDLIDRAHDERAAGPGLAALAPG